MFSLTPTSYSGSAMATLPNPCSAQRESFRASKVSIGDRPRTAMEYDFRNLATDNIFSRAATEKPTPPGLLRGYSEESKFGLLSGKSHSRTKTLSSLYLPLGSRDLSLKDNLGISRWSPNRSDTNSVNRQEISQAFGSIFSRTGRKEKKDRSGNHLFQSSTSNMASDMGKASTHKDRENLNRVNVISEPYNFRHIRHARQEAVPVLMRRPPSDLSLDSRSSSHVLNPIDIERQSNYIFDNLHFENFSSEALAAQVSDDHLQIPVESGNYRNQVPLRKKHVVSGRNIVSQTFLHDDPISPQPCLTPRYPISNHLTEPLPVRMSSRVASSYEPNLCLRSESDLNFPYGLPTPPTPCLTTGHHEYFNHPVITKEVEEESWPLPCTNNTNGPFGVELADVQEEEEFQDEKLVQILDCMQLDGSPSIPVIANGKSFDDDEKLLGSAENYESLEKNEAVALGSAGDEIKPTEKQTTSDSPTSENVSWESDIDWCYENEVEADCDYRWIEDERRGDKYDGKWIEDHNKIDPSKLLKLTEESRALQILPKSNEGDYRKSFFSCLLLPKDAESPPELSPDSIVFPSSIPRDPVSLPGQDFIQSSSMNYPRNECDDLGLHLAQTIPSYYPTPAENDYINGEDCTWEKFKAVSPLRSFNSSFSSSRESMISYCDTRTLSSHSSIISPPSTTASCSVDSPERKHQKNTSNTSVKDCFNTVKTQSLELLPSTHTHHEHSLGTKAAVINFARHTSETLLIDRRKKSLTFDAWRASQPVHLSNAPNPNSNFDDCKSRNSSYIRLRSGQKEVTSIPHTGKLRKKRSQSYNLSMRGKSSYGLFPQI